jgi:hypothetical protein
MMQKLVLSRRMLKWAYSLVEYELSYGPRNKVKGQVVTDFIVDHGIQLEDASLVTRSPWKVYFDGSVCTKWCGIGYVRNQVVCALVYLCDE